MSPSSKSSTTPSSGLNIYRFKLWRHQPMGELGSLMLIRLFVYTRDVSPLTSFMHRDVSWSVSETRVITFFGVKLNLKLNSSQFLVFIRLTSFAGMTWETCTLLASPCGHLRASGSSKCTLCEWLPLKLVSTLVWVVPSHGILLVILQPGRCGRPQTFVPMCWVFYVLPSS